MTTSTTSAPGKMSNCDANMNFEGDIINQPFRMIFNIIHLFSKQDILKLKQKDAQISLRLEMQKLKQIEIIVR